jgi:hypothetical protein
VFPVLDVLTYAYLRTTKASLNDKVVSTTSSGRSVMTNKSLNREVYLDATQRGMINAMKATSFGPTSADGSRKSLSDIDKHIKQAPDSPLDDTTTKKRIFLERKVRK